MRKLQLPDLRPVHPVRLAALVYRLAERERSEKAGSRDVASQREPALAGSKP